VKQTYALELYNTTLVAGAAPVSTSSFSLPEGGLFEKIGLYVEYTPSAPGNQLTIAALWENIDTGAIQLESFVNPTATPITASVVVTACNPGGAWRMTLLVSSSGTGDDTLRIVAASNYEP
jgi:hypothetical protein